MAAKLVLAVAAVLLCLQLAAAQKMIETPQPLFAWSSAPGSVSTEQRTISLAKLTLEGIVLRLVGRAELDLGVVYLIPQLRTDRMRDGALPAVKAAVRGAQSSLILPYTTGSGITALLNLDATRFLLFGEPIEGLEASPLASLDDVKNAISQLGRNQQREVIVIELPLDLDQADAIIADVEAALQADANSYVSFLTVSEPAEQVELNFLANPTRRTRSVQLTSVNEGNANVADTPPVVYTNRWPAGVITGLLLGAMTLFFLIIGFLATMDVQSPERFESSEKKQRSSS